jgi:hypothetical protein
MTKDELVALCERCWATWNQTPGDTRHAYEAWWRLLGDLEADTVNAAVDRLAVSTTFLPRPGELRRLAMGDDVPSDADAWASYRQVARAMEHGTEVPDVHELVRSTMARTGGGLHTNGDRQFFLEAYGETVARWRQERYAP